MAAVFSPAHTSTTRHTPTVFGRRSSFLWRPFAVSGNSWKRLRHCTRSSVTSLRRRRRLTKMAPMLGAGHSKSQCHFTNPAILFVPTCFLHYRIGIAGLNFARFKQLAAS
ncbi:hypothetical protein K505DRAFT_132379 [Melanomma pulvis-pyrius CBS 109.77]|uniref:Uncharacterized protein n=1 Tax=Melanomma pulvis-pyrius CBS 109.77 TaxID=1314802 RepID=A0A6A6XMI0_9PLEO|nr:hypothetical protein K505DRAFT_132379 [Melanomma pulvis-pyrius CBS 109.77]